MEEPWLRRVKTLSLSRTLGREIPRWHYGTDTENTQLQLGQKDSKQHETGLQRKFLKERKNLIGLTMLGGFFSSGREFEEELGYKEKQATEKAKYLCHKKHVIIVHYKTSLWMLIQKCWYSDTTMQILGGQRKNFAFLDGVRKQTSRSFQGIIRRNKTRYRHLKLYETDTNICVLNIKGNFRRKTYS